MDNSNTRQTTHANRELTEQQKRKLEHAKQQRFERIISVLSRNNETREKWSEESKKEIQQ